MKQNIHYACYDEILSEAHRAGVYHGLDLKPTPMVVEDHVNVLDDNSDVKHAYYVPSGVCGFAYIITNEHGNSKFVKYLKSIGEGNKYYYGGYYVKWVREFGQSLEKKEAYARAYAGVLKTYGIDVYINSRMD